MGAAARGAWPGRFQRAERDWASRLPLSQAALDPGDSRPRRMRSLRPPPAGARHPAAAGSPPDGPDTMRIKKKKLLLLALILVPLAMEAVFWASFDVNWAIHILPP